MGEVVLQVGVVAEKAVDQPVVGFASIDQAFFLQHL